MIIVREADKQLCGKRLGSGLKITVFSLRDSDGISNLLLRQIGIFA